MVIWNGGPWLAWLTGGMSSFVGALASGWQNGRFCSIGLDPDINRIPNPDSLDPARAMVAFNRKVIEATSELVVAYKPQVAHYEGIDGGWAALRETIAIAHELAPDVPVILDAKRADIGSTNEAYAATAFDYLEADAITVHPYLGPEAMVPFLERTDKGVIVLCRTSNPGANRYQGLRLQSGEFLYQRIAADVAGQWNANGNCGLVVGATAPSEMAEVRRLAPSLPLLVPGIGAQGGDLEASVQAGLDVAGTGLIIHASRSVLYAYEQTGDIDVSGAIRRAATKLHSDIADARDKLLLA